VNGLSFAASSSALAVRQAINNRLRTGTDKGMLFYFSTTLAPKMLL